MKKDFVSITDLNKNEIIELLVLAKKVKANRGKDKKILKDKKIALIFTKPSHRTRVSFEVGIVELGGYPLYLAPHEIRLGEREAIKDAAKVLSRYVDGIVIRTFGHEDVVELARYADIPVINGLSDLCHPCQILSDMLTIEEKIGLKNKKIVYIGDGNNIAHSWLHAAAIYGLYLVICTPEKFKPDQNIFNESVKQAKKIGAIIQYEQDPKKAVKDADVIYTDVWASMGQEKEAQMRKKAFAAYQVSKQLMSYAKKNALFMHCLPAHRGDEVTDEVIDSKNSVVYDEAENRLHMQKAILMKLFERGNQK